MKTIFCTALMLWCTFLFAQTAESLKEKALKANQRKNYAQAIAYMDQAIALDKNNARYYGLKATILGEMKKPQEAFDEFSRAISIDSSLDWLYMNRGNIMMSVGMMDEALSDFNTGLKYAKGDSAIRPYYLNRSAAKLQKRDFEGGLKDLTYAYSLDSLDVGVLLNLASVYNELDQNKEAIKYLERALKLAPNDLAVLSNLGFIYQSMTEYKKSIEYFDICVKMQPGEGVPYSNRSYSKLKMGDVSGALKDINKSIELYPANSYAWRNRGLVYLEMKKHAEACSDFHTAIAKGYTEMYGKDVQELIDKNCTLFK